MCRRAIVRRMRKSVSSFVEAAAVQCSVVSEQEGNMLIALLVLTAATARAQIAQPKLNFSQDYDKHELPPSADQKPVLIRASINLRNILDVAEKQQLISLETTLRLYWKVN